jgi:hypothetical protein
MRHSIGVWATYDASFPCRLLTRTSLRSSCLEEKFGSSCHGVRRVERLSRSTRSPPTVSSTVLRKCSASAQQAKCTLLGRYQCQPYIPRGSLQGPGSLFAVFQCPCHRQQPLALVRQHSRTRLVPLRATLSSMPSALPSEIEARNVVCDQVPPRFQC